MKKIQVRIIHRTAVKGKLFMVLQGWAIIKTGHKTCFKNGMENIKTFDGEK